MNDAELIGCMGAGVIAMTTISAPAELALVTDDVPGALFGYTQFFVFRV